VFDVKLAGELVNEAIQHPGYLFNLGTRLAGIRLYRLLGSLAHSRV